LTRNLLDFCHGRSTGRPGLQIFPQKFDVGSQDLQFLRNRTTGDLTADDNAG